MSKITRRKVLTGIAGCSLAAAFGGCNKNSNQKESADSSQNKMAGPLLPSKLNVFIHGLCVLYVNKDSTKGITLYMPLIQDPNPPHDTDHRYWFGNITDAPGHRTDLLKSIAPKGVCKLSGVTSGSHPDGSFFKADLVFPAAKVISPDSMRQFILPWTTNIQSVALRERKDHQPLLTDSRPNPTYNNVTQLSTICILTYDFVGNTPQIAYDDGTDTGWTLPPAVLSGSVNYFNLHVYAEPKDDHADHALKSFPQLMATINQQLLTFNKFQDGDMDKITDNPIPGVADVDLKSLADLFKAGEVANCVRAVVIE